MKRGVKRSIRLIFFFSLLCITAPAIAVAGETEDFQFAKKLQRDGMFVAAAEEFLRFAEEYPYSTLRDDALIGAGEAYMRAGKAALALDVFERFLEAYGGDEKACKARFYRGRILKALGRFREAAVEYLKVDEESPGCALVDDSLLEGGECLLSAGEPEEAAGVFRRLINQWGRSDLVPRAMYGLALALVGGGRDLGAEKVLTDLVEKHGASPVAALALVKLGEWALARGDVDRAKELFRRVVDRYEEETLQEKGLFNLIDIYARRGDDAEILETVGRYLGRFPEGPRRGAVYRRGIAAARNLGRLDRALELVDGCLAEGAVQDSTGGLTLQRGAILAAKGRTDEALAALVTFRRRYPLSPDKREGLVLEAELRGRGGSPREAARLYHLALLEENSGPDDATILTRLAELSIDGLADTVSAIRYWDMVVREDRDGEMAEEALWREGTARERIGDLDGAGRAYEMLTERFPGGRRFTDAERRLEYIGRVPRWGKDAVRELASTAASGAPEGARRVRAAVVLLDTARDPEGAVRVLESALAMDLPDTLRAKARYYYGKANAHLYEKTAARGEGDAEARGRALTTWWNAARDYVGTAYGMRSHRDYLEYRLDDLDPSERLKKLDEFSNIYGGPPGQWAAGKKIDVLYEMAREGERWAADSARVLCTRLLRGDGTGTERREAQLKFAYLSRMVDDLPAARRAFEDFISRYGDDRRVTPARYDLGETLMRLKEYDAAQDAYEACLEGVPPRALAQKCLLRIGDCRYFRYRFEEAAGSYAQFVTQYPESDLSNEAAYREALALERLGRANEVDSILAYLAGVPDLDRGLRARLLRKLGTRMHERGESESARSLVEELVTIERSPRNLQLLAEILFALEEYESSIDVYSDALKAAGADTCAILSGRARARLHRDEYEQAQQDITALAGRCPADAIAAVYLERGIVEVKRGLCEDAERTLHALREQYPGGDAALKALYHLAICDMKRGGYAEAIDKLNAFIREAPNSPIIGDVYFKLASAQFGAGNPNLAAASYTLAAEATPDAGLRFMALKNVGAIYQELEEWERAAQAWRGITEQFPEGEGVVEIFFNLGFCYGQSGRHDMAYEVYSRIPGIAENEEQQGRAHYWSGICLKNLDRCDEAVRAFLRVPYLRTGGMWGVTAKLEAALCYEEIGETDQAVEIYRDIISSHGEGSDWGKVARKSLDRIEGREKQRGGAPGTGGGSPDRNGDRSDEDARSREGGS